MNRFSKKQQQPDCEKPEKIAPMRDFKDDDEYHPLSEFSERLRLALYFIVPLIVLIIIIIAGVWIAFNIVDKAGSSEKASPSLLSLNFDESNIPQLLEAHLEAIGGREAIEFIRSVRYEGRLVSGSVLYDYVTLLHAPDKGMILQSPRASKSGTRQLLLNGEKAWQFIYQKDGSRIAVPLKETTKNLLKWSLRIHNPFRKLALEGAAEGLEFSEIEFMGKPCYELTGTMPDGSKLVAVLDKESLYLLKTSEVLDLGEGPQEYRVLYDDHRVISGVVFPHHSRFFKNGKPNNEAYMTSYQANPGLVSWLFTVPDEMGQ